MSDFDRIFDKIDQIDNRLNNIDHSLVRQTVSLEEHIKRTNLLENEIKPLKSSFYLVEAIFKIVGLISVISSVIFGFYRLFK